MPQNSTRRTRLIVAAAGLALALGAADGAQAVGFNIFDEPGGTLLGTFDAPAGGGAMASLTATIGGVTYDTLAGGASAPTYYAATNDIGGAGSSMGYATNSAAAGVCGAGECAFSFYRIFDPTIPGEWYTDLVYVPPEDQTPLDLGYYKVAPVPGPLGAMLLMSAIAAIAGITRRRRFA